MNKEEQSCTLPRTIKLLFAQRLALMNNVFPHAHVYSGFGLCLGFACVCEVYIVRIVHLFKSMNSKEKNPNNVFYLCSDLFN